MTVTAHQASGTGTATWLAERAVLGDLVLCPQRTALLSEWLRPEHFFDPDLAHTYRAMLNLTATGALASVDERVVAHGAIDTAIEQTVRANLRLITAALRESPSADTTPSRVDLVDLYRAGLRRTSVQTAWCARQVLGMHVRRWCEEIGIRLAAAVRTADPPNAVNLTHTTDAVAWHARELDDALRRARGEDLPLAPLDGRTGPAPWTGTAPPAPPLPAALVAESQRRVIHAAVSDDPRLHDQGWIERLQAGDFVGNPDLAATWDAVRAVAAAGLPIDPVTVAWHAEARRPADPAVAPALAATELAAMHSPPTGDLDRALSIVARTALAHYGGQIPEQIAELTVTRTIDPQIVLAATGTAAGALAGHADRLAPVTGSRIANMLAGSPASARLPTTDPTTRHAPGR